MTVLGIADPGVWLAYLLSILSAVFCIVYGFVNWNKGDERIQPEDIKWVKAEIKAEKDI
ncbi:MAG: hypothetical protein PHE18_03005 [Candidatus Omnitrophica bacterium]|nr:hypothetical protein [Candidatus Omnitrophota bacterium]MDD5552823.1 hypothetical protein [Candidatus Omnitrophota bacterium]